VRRRPVLTGAIAIALLLAIGFLTGVIPKPNVEDTLLKVGKALGPWTYLLVGAMAFLETGAFVGFIAPGETAVLVGGVVAGQGEIDPIVLIGIVWACALAGDVTSYFIGRRLGRAFILRHGHHLRITPQRLEQVEGFFHRRGAATILIGRFIGVVRPLVPFVAGTAGFPLRRFIGYDVLGTGLWSSVFVLLGYVFWHSFHQLASWVGRGLTGIAVVFALGVVAVFLMRLARDPDLRARTTSWVDAHTDRRGLRWLARAHRRLLALVRFVDHLDWELVALLAVSAVGFFVFAALGLQVDTHPYLPGDAEAARIARSLSTDVAVSVVKILTDLGAFPVTATLTVAVAVWAYRRGRRAEAAALVAGMLLGAAISPIAKAYWERPRPLDALVHVGGYAYPSGHAVHATAYLACAVVLVRAGHGLAVRFAAVTVGAVIMAAIALSRVYLRVHHLSDVIGGVALGLASFALCGAIALLLPRIRDRA
jgi:undecaprenyl-diphosphatase